MKKLMLILLQNKGIARVLIRPVLWLHNQCYKVATLCAVALNNGTHPKKEIIQYHKWFMDHISADDYVVDIGSNTGELAKTLSQKASMVTGIEINEKLYRKSLTASGSNLKFIHADATRFSYDKIEKISVITLSNVLEHIKDRVDFLRSVNERVNWVDSTKKMMLIRVPLLTRDWLVVYKKQMNVEWRLDNTHETEYSIEDLEFELQQIQFEISSSQVKFGELFAVCKPRQN